MGRPRRQILSNGVYEICIKTRKGLPFVCTAYMKLIIKSVIARVQRDSKVIISHLVVMGNHFHILVTAKDAEQCTRFYGEMQKQLTDAIKQLLGLTQLSLWQSNGTSVLRYGDLKGTRERIAYYYANPSKAHLIDRIEHYPGLSSWEVFNKTPHKLSATYREKCPWVRWPTISKLPVLSMSEPQDRAFTERLQQLAKREHELVLQPNAWMIAFGIKDAEVKEENALIVSRLREMEQDSRNERVRRGFRVKGAEKLKREALNLSYVSKGESRKIFIYAANPEVRKAMIIEYQHFCERCEECYCCWKIGDYSVNWPPGAFLPGVPPRVNWFA